MSDMNPLDRSPEDYEAASFMAGLSTANVDAASVNAFRKREHDGDDDGVPPAAKASKSSALDTTRGCSDADASTVKAEKSSKGAKREKKTPGLDEKDAMPALKAAPFFYYTDHSRDVDSDPLTLLTESGHVPNFPVKMHAILSNPELKHIIAWDSHGRSFKILRPRQFESYILPRYFEHSRMCSFLRQVNGWGFRRLVGGDYRNSYYEEHFLRNMPWLCKRMRRPKIGEKMDIPPEYEPDLKAISAQFPLPNHPISREIQVVLETIESGPKARMPFNWIVDEDLLRASGSGQTPSKTNPSTSRLVTVKNEDHKRAAQPNPPLDPNEKNNPEPQPALLPIAATLKSSPTLENETLLLNYLRRAQQSKSFVPTNVMTQMHQAAALVQASNLGRTDPEFLVGLAAATQRQNATTHTAFGGAFHSQAVPNFVASSVTQGETDANSVIQAILGLNQGSRGNNGLGNALSSITALQPRTNLQRDMTTNVLLEAILSERNLSNAGVGGAFLPLQPQSVRRRSPAAAMQREVKANLLLRAIQKHQGIEDSNGSGNTIGNPTIHHQAVAHSISPNEINNMNTNLPLQTLISQGNIHNSVRGLSHSSNGTMHFL